MPIHGVSLDKKEEYGYSVNMSNTLHDDILRLLIQEQELYGDEFTRDPGTSGLWNHVSWDTPEYSTTDEERPPVVAERIETDMPKAIPLPTLSALQKTISACTKCELCKTRTQTVFGSGNPNADIMFIGEAPGADEDEQGLPFVGRAGQLLTKMIEEPRSLNLPRSEVYIANILKCRPPGNRKPLPAEVAQCEPYLITQIELIKPRIICALGATSANTLLKNNTPIGAMRGQTFDYHGVPLLITYHPAALLRNPNWKKPAWEDMLTLRTMYDKLKK